MENIQKMETCKLRTECFIELKWECKHKFGKKTKKTKSGRTLFYFSPPPQMPDAADATPRGSSSPPSLSCAGVKSRAASPRGGSRKTNKLFFYCDIEKKKKSYLSALSVDRFLVWPRRCKPPQRPGRRPRVAPPQALNKKPLWRLVD